MAKRKEIPDTSTILKLLTVNQLDKAIHPTAFTTKGNTNYKFDIDMEHRIIQADKQVSVIMSISILADGSLETLGSLSSICSFEISNFNELMKIDQNDTPQLSSTLINEMNIIAMSSTRGLMYLTFRRTYLHNAYLSTVDPINFLKPCILDPNALKLKNTDVV